MVTKALYFLFFAALWIQCSCQVSSDRLTNPILASGADPWIIQQDQWFHYCYSRGDRICLKSVRKLSELPEAAERVLWLAPQGTGYSKEIWAPELHYIDSRWFVYFAADDGENAHHRMHVLSSEGENISSEFQYTGQITDPTDKWAIDGTVLSLRGDMYFIWSGWEGDHNGQQNLYLAHMDGPAAISSERVLISSPEFEWEKRGSSPELPTINEGPEVLIKEEQVYIIYSASGSWSDDYCLGLLEYTGGDPMIPESWKKRDQPVFRGTEKIISPGHCSFLHIEGQDYIVYHHAKHPGAGWKREVSIQPFSWDEKGPVFGQPMPNGSEVLIRY
ncbi:MAG: family 43 glycosylhydrolase [Saprospiraceae bacterium]|nr:family 43 glycosylhydrolase [Saprospiraceae bacterium]MCB9321119.1 family 43 glycosylhydrolase [Lewinellaceae bacterium]